MKEFLFLLDGLSSKMCNIQHLKIKANNEQDALILACKHLYLNDTIFMDDYNLRDFVNLEDDEIGDDVDREVRKEILFNKSKEYFRDYKESAQAFVDFVFATKNEFFACRKKFIDVSKEFLLDYYVDYITGDYKIIDLEEIRVIKE